MTEFGASATLQVSVDSSSLREAKADVEDSLGTVTVGGGGGAGAVADGGDGGTNLAGLQTETVDILEDILDELQTGGAVGGGGGGGGARGLAGGGGGGLALAARLGGGLTTGALTAQLTGAGGAGGLLGGPEDVGPGAVAFGRGLNDVFGLPDEGAPEGEAPIDGVLSALDGLGAPGDRPPRAQGGPPQSARGPPDPSGPDTALVEDDPSVPTAGSLADATGTGDADPSVPTTGSLADATVGSVTRTRGGDPLAGTNRLGDREPGVDPSNVPSQGSRDGQTQQQVDVTNDVTVNVEGRVEEALDRARRQVKRDLRREMQGSGL